MFYEGLLAVIYSCTSYL